MEQENKDKKARSRRAQTASELAIFGAILIFVIGIIVRSGMSAGQVMNQQLKAMRMALRWSYDSSIARGKSGFTSRNVANIVVLEDRLSIDAGNKLGSRDRIPMIQSGSGMMTNQIFQSIYWGETSNLSIYDLFVNGQHFPLITAKFKTITLDASHPNYEAQCYDADPITAGVQWGGCVKFYQVVGNYPDSADWCVDPGCGTDNLPEDERFDLDHNDATFCSGCTDGADVPDDLRRNKKDGNTHAFSWQWIMQPALKKDSTSVANQQLYPSQTFAGIKVLDDDDDTEQDEGGHIDDVYDVDGDGKEEIVHDINCGGVNFDGHINCVRYTDSQDGDIDFTYNDNDKAHGILEPGLQDDLQMFSFTRGVRGAGVNPNGTYLLLEEGKLFNPDTRRFVRSTNRQDHVDIIQRIFRLSSNTGRFCQGSTPTCWPQVNPATPNCTVVSYVPFQGLYDWRGDVAGSMNPVEACNNCFSEANVAKTCMDTTQKLIFIRSRIADMRGRRWVTRKLD